MRVDLGAGENVAAQSVREGWLRLRVASAVLDGAVRVLQLVAPSGGPLPGFTPGSHIVIDAGGCANAYSLTGPFLEPEAYEVSVLRLDDGDGGSRWLHDSLAVGDVVTVSPPRSAFAPVTPARHHLLIAGGIGITPILSHARAAAFYDRSFEVLLARRPGTMSATVAALEGVCGPGRLRVMEDRVELMEVVERRLSDQPLGTVAYICGPAEMIEAVTAVAHDLGWPEQRIATEHFTTEALEPGDPFTVALAQSGRTLQVASGVSLLEALEAAEIAVPNLCRKGVCGECRVPVSSGRPLHRDLFLSEEEKAAGDSLMCCVSRAHDGVLELDL